MSAVIPYRTGAIELEISLALGREASAGVWDTGQWDFSTWGTGDTALGDWVDVTCDVIELELTSGASAPDGVITSIDATTGVVHFRGEVWNPWASPWAGVLGPDVPVRIRWRRPAVPANAWRPVYLGVSDGWPYDRDTLDAKVPLVDGTGYLSSYKMVAQPAPVGDNETIADRMNRILDGARWTGARDIAVDPGVVRCISTLLEGEAWDSLATAADTDLGILWMSRAGAVSYRPVAQAGQWTPSPVAYRLTDTDGPATDVCVVNYTRTDPQVLRNDVTISHDKAPGASVDPPEVRVADDASIQRYGPRTYSRTDLIHNADSWSSTVAYVILQSGAWPRPHPQTAELDIRADRRVAELLLDTEIAQTINALDSGTVYPCVVVGHSLDLTLSSLSGTLVLDDVSLWVAGRWDSAKWDIDRWGV